MSQRFQYFGVIGEKYKPKSSIAQLIAMAIGYVTRKKITIFYHRRRLER